MSTTLSIKIPEPLKKQLEGAARRQRTTLSRLLQESLQRIIEQESGGHPPSCYDLSGDLLDRCGRGPRELSTSQRHFADFGR